MTGARDMAVGHCNAVGRWCDRTVFVTSKIECDNCYRPARWLTIWIRPPSVWGAARRDGWHGAKKSRYNSKAPFLCPPQAKRLMKRELCHFRQKYTAVLELPRVWPRPTVGAPGASNENGKENKAVKLGVKLACG